MKMLGLKGLCMHACNFSPFFPCSVFYVFYEQYLTVVKDTWENLLYCAGKFCINIFLNILQTWDL